MQQTPQQLDAPAPCARRSAFTLIELLVVIAVLALLVGIAGVVYTNVVAGSRRAATQQFMRGLTVAIEQFYNDFGYYPPLLAPDGMVNSNQGWNVESPQPQELDEIDFVAPIAQNDPNSALRNARYMSLVSLPLYLMGVGDLAPTDYQPDDDPARHDGVAGPGFRAPGADKAWGGARTRDDRTHRPSFTGRTYDPYMDVGSGRNWRRIADFRAVAATTDEDPAFDDPELLEPEARQFFTFEDQWGGVIRYYRSWPTRDIEDTSLRTIDRIPIELLQESTLTAGFDADENFQTALERDLLNSPYALLSAGPDGKFADTRTPTTPELAGEEGFVAGSLPEDYDAGDLAMDMQSGEPDAWRELVRTISDNVRVLP